MEAEERTSLSEWGIYIAGVASVLIWLLKAFSDKSKNKQQRVRKDRNGVYKQTYTHVEKGRHE